MIEKFVANSPPARSLWKCANCTVHGWPGAASATSSTILIVEDEMRMLRLLVRFFSRHGFRVLQATDGEQALEIYRREAREIDAVLLDVRLPKKTGDQVFREMRTVNPAVKVVLASGYYLDPKIKTDMTSAGIKYFVDKPYVLNDLLVIVENMLSKG
jgi:two-component system, cell cycle sensor histidine kinase and response regulator CckA